MADVEQQDIITRLTTLINTLDLCFFANFTPPSKVADYEDASSSSPRSPDSNSPPRKIPGKREPDIALSRRGEESSDSSASPEKKRIKFSRDRPPLAVIEVTSSSTRTEDLYVTSGPPMHALALLALLMHNLNKYQDGNAVPMAIRSSGAVSEKHSGLCK